MNEHKKSNDDETEFHKKAEEEIPPPDTIVGPFIKLQDFIREATTLHISRQPYNPGLLGSEEFKGELVFEFRKSNTSKDFVELCVVLFVPNDEAKKLGGKWLKLPDVKSYYRLPTAEDPEQIESQLSQGRNQALFYISKIEKQDDGSLAVTRSSMSRGYTDPETRSYTPCIRVEEVMMIPAWLVATVENAKKMETRFLVYMRSEGMISHYLPKYVDSAYKDDF